MINTAIYPGTFDPITNGHLDVVRRALRQYDKVVVAVSDHDTSKKTPLFSASERKALVEAATAGYGEVEVVTFSGLVANFAKEMGADAIIRGLRVASDFEYEFTMAQFIREQAPEVEMVYVMASNDVLHISSSFIKEIASLGGDVGKHVPQVVVEALHGKLK